MGDKNDEKMSNRLPEEEIEVGSAEFKQIVSSMIQAELSKDPEDQKYGGQRGYDLLMSNINKCLVFKEQGKKVSVEFKTGVLSNGFLTMEVYFIFEQTGEMLMVCMKEMSHLFGIYV